MSAKVLDGITLFVNSDLAREIDQEAGEFCGVIVACLSRKRSISHAVAIEEQREMARLLKARGIVPEDCDVRIVGLSLEDTGAAGLVVNYKERAK